MIKQYQLMFVNYHRILSITALCLIAQLVSVSNAAAEVHRVSFDHKSITTLKPIIAQPGDKIEVTITNTCVQAFDYRIEGALKNEITGGFGRESLDFLENKCTATFKATQTHEEQYAGYYITVNSNGVSGYERQTVGLTDKTFVIAVKTSSWDLDYSGGFTLSSLTNPIFATRNVSLPDGSMQEQIFRDKGAEDDLSLGLAGMVHLTHRKHPKLAWTFGLSVAEDGDTSYMFGPSLRLGEKANATFGVIAGKVDRLPAGLQVGSPVSNANELSSLGRKTDTGLFIAISYSFMGGIGQGFFDKPFKGE